MTVDTNDLEHFMQELEENDFLPDARRMTADPVDMAALLENMEEETIHGRVSMVSLNMSEYSNVGRESIDTVTLMKNVNEVLSKSNMSADESNRASMDSYSTISNLSFKSDIDCDRDTRRMTVDAIDLQDIVDAVDNDFTEHSQEGSVNTIDLLVSVQGALHAFNPDAAEHSPETLRNMLEVKQASSSQKKSAPVEAFQSPTTRRSSRLSKDSTPVSFVFSSAIIFIFRSVTFNLIFRSRILL